MRRSFVRSFVAVALLSSVVFGCASARTATTTEPLDWPTVFQSVRKTHRLVCVDETKPFCGVSSQVAAEVGRACFDHLDAPILRVTSVEAPMPFSSALEDECIPNVARIIEAVKQVVA